MTKSACERNYSLVKLKNKLDFAMINFKRNPKDNTYFMLWDGSEHASVINKTMTCLTKVEKVVIILQSCETNENLTAQSKEHARNEITILREKEKKLITETLIWLQKYDHPNEALNFLLDIPATNPFYIEAHTQAFQITYHGHYDEKIQPSAAAQNALVNALPCCLSDDGNFLTFNKSDQAFIDSCLIAAAGIELGMNKIYDLSDEQRMGLLKYALLLANTDELSDTTQAMMQQVKQEISLLPKSSGIGPSKFFNKSDKPLTGSVNNFLNSLNQQLDESWKDSANASLSDENQTLLFQAVSKMEDKKFVFKPGKK